MARSKKESKEKIQDMSLTFAEHLSYLIFFDSKENSKHWRNELSALLFKIWGYTRVRDSKGVTVLTHSEIMDYLYDTTWLGSVDTVTHMYRFSVSHNKKLKPLISNVDLSARSDYIMKEVLNMYSEIITLLLSKEFTRSSAEIQLKYLLSKVYV